MALLSTEGTIHDESHGTTDHLNEVELGQAPPPAEISQDGEEPVRLLINYLIKIKLIIGSKSFVLV